MYSDIDVKIAGDKPSKDVKRNLSLSGVQDNISKTDIDKAKKFGEAVAMKFLEDTNINTSERETNIEMITQRKILLSFTATVGFEMFSPDDTVCGIAQKSFLDTLKEKDEYSCDSDDTGAFSFYYLAFRRGSQVDRRIGQTFAMLCSHDGDPIYHELGEALYCWFLSKVKEVAENIYGKEN